MTPSTKLESYKNIAARWIEEGWQNGNTAVIDELHSADFIDHSAAGRTNNNEGFKKGIKDLYVSFPDFYAVIDDIISDPKSGKTVVRWSAKGTHKGEFNSIPPAQKEISFSGIEIIRIEKGKITDRWGEWNGDEVLEQIKDCE